MMKKLLYLFVLICSVSLFTSCNDNDDDDTGYIQTELDGVYKGALDVKVTSLNIDEKNIPQKVYITKTGENLIKLELKQFAFQGIPVGDIVVENIAVIKNGNSCTFTGSDKLILVVGECAVSVNGIIEDDNIAIDIMVNIGSVMDVEVNFEGVKQTADQSSEAKILTFSFDNAHVVGMPIIEETTVHFIISEDMPEAELKALTPTFTISEKATVDKQSGTPQDFSTPVSYVVTSEDGIAKTTYIVSVLGKEKSFNFEDWTVVKTTTNDSEEQYEVPANISGTSNPGMLFINEMIPQLGLSPLEYPVAQVAGESGKAAQLKTVHTAISSGGMDFNAAMGGMIPYVTAGSLFTGVFKTDISNPLNSTKFGVLHLGEPVTFSGSYKFTSGTEYRSNTNMVVADKTDKCSVYAVLYEELPDSKGVNIPLTGNYNDKEAYIGTSSRVVMRAALADGSGVADWKEFSVPFTKLEGKTYDATKKYYLAIICSSSAEGDRYEGAPGSTLLVDNLKVVSR